jgi:hypothetical protein
LEAPCWRFEAVQRSRAGGGVTVARKTKTAVQFRRVLLFKLRKRAPSLTQHSAAQTAQRQHQRGPACTRANRGKLGTHVHCSSIVSLLLVLLAVVVLFRRLRLLRAPLLLLRVRGLRGLRLLRVLLLLLPFPPRLLLLLLLLPLLLRLRLLLDDDVFVVVVVLRRLLLLLLLDVVVVFRSLRIPCLRAVRAVRRGLRRPLLLLLLVRGQPVVFRLRPRPEPRCQHAAPFLLLTALMVDHVGNV